jgi:hypothetical protein
MTYETKIQVRKIDQCHWTVRTLLHGSGVTISSSRRCLLCPLMKLQVNLTGCCVSASFMTIQCKDKETFRSHYMLYIHEYKSSVECCVICRSPELQSTCLIFLDGVDSSNLSLLFKPRVMSSLRSSDRAELLCWSLLFLEQFPVSNPDLRFEDRTTLGSNRMQIKIKKIAGLHLRSSSAVYDIKIILLSLSRY